MEHEQKRERKRGERGLMAAWNNFKVPEIFCLLVVGRPFIQGATEKKGRIPKIRPFFLVSFI